MKAKTKKKFQQQSQKFQQLQKGLFTFYREQAQYQQKLALQKKINKLRKKLNKQTGQNQAQTQVNNKNNLYQGIPQRSFSILQQKDNRISNSLLDQQRQNQNYSEKQIGNKQKIGIIAKTHKKSPSYIIIDEDRITPSKQQRIQQKFGQSVIIIKKKKTQTEIQNQLQKQKLSQMHKNYSYQHNYKANRYGSQKGYYIKKKEVNLFGNFKNDLEDNNLSKQNQQQNQSSGNFKNKEKYIDLTQSSSQKYLRLKLEKQKGLIKLKHYQRPSQLTKVSPPHQSYNNNSNNKNHHQAEQNSTQNTRQKQLKSQNLNLKNSQSQKLDKSFQKQLKKIQVFPQIKLPSISTYNSSQKMNGSKHLPHNKIFTSMLKSTDTELVKHIRKALQFQKGEHNNNLFNERLTNPQDNSLNFMIEYNKYSAEDSSFQFKSNNLNEKQKRLLNILNQFRKVHD